jgi:hypothetical protein
MDESRKMIMITVYDPNVIEQEDCKLEVDVEEAEGYHQDETIQTRQSYTYTSYLSLPHPLYDSQ